MQKTIYYWLDFDNQLTEVKMKLSLYLSPILSFLSFTFQCVFFLFFLFSNSYIYATEPIASAENSKENIISPNRIASRIHSSKFTCLSVLPNGDPFHCMFRGSTDEVASEKKNSKEYFTFKPYKEFKLSLGEHETGKLIIGKDGIFEMDTDLGLLGTNWTLTNSKNFIEGSSSTVGDFIYGRDEHGNGFFTFKPYKEIKLSSGEYETIIGELTIGKDGIFKMDTEGNIEGEKYKIK